MLRQWFQPPFYKGRALSRDRLAAVINFGLVGGWCVPYDCAAKQPVSALNVFSRYWVFERHRYWGFASFHSMVVTCFQPQ